MFNIHESFASELSLLRDSCRSKLISDNVAYIPYPDTFQEVKSKGEKKKEVLETECRDLFCSF